MLLISLGIGPAPVAAKSNALNSLTFSPPRAEMLVSVESKGKVASPPSALPPDSGMPRPMDRAISQKH